MMKKIYIAVLLITAALVGCNDWLDVNPRQEMKESSLYTTEDGFKNALTGAYIQLANSKLYGRNTSMYLPEMLARHYRFPTSPGTIEYAFGKYDYTQKDIEALIENIWKSYYTAIVHINNVLHALEENEIYFTYHNDELIKGEALGLRAFLHFELLRYFGEVPSKANSGDRAIPYVTEMTKDANKLVSKTWEEVLRNIEDDLKEAEKLLEKADPIFSYTNRELNNPGSSNLKGPEDEWHYYRQNRFNYYAVLATKARFYQWINKKEEASAYAKRIIEAKNNDKEETPKFRLQNENDYNGTGILVFPSEHLFSVHNPNFQQVVEPLFKKEDALTQSTANMDKAYEKTTNPDDIRYKENRSWIEELYQNSVKVNQFVKYIGNSKNAPDNIIPVIRLSEMYLILVENLPLEEAKGYFETYRISRSLRSDMTGSLTNEDKIKERLELEYRKEFFLEGQMFFFYKRFNYSTFAWPASFNLPDNAYKLPLPKSQSAFE